MTFDLESISSRSKLTKKSILYSKFSKFKMEWNGYSENTGKWTIRENKPQMYNLEVDTNYRQENISHPHLLCSEVTWCGTGCKGWSHKAQPSPCLGTPVLRHCPRHGSDTLSQNTLTQVSHVSQVRHADLGANALCNGQCTCIR